MTDKSYREFFKTAMGREDKDDAPYPYQEKLAIESWPELLDIPTGLGKTAAVVLAWIHKRMRGDATTPRRLVYCLPMRVLVEQTHDNITTWLTRLGCYAEAPGGEGISVHLLMGGEADKVGGGTYTRSWVEYPECDAILIGTQDMLLSRALMRGYGMSRYRWPIDFSLLHNDALWVFDEVQLMGAGLPTSTQLEAFRRRQDMPGSARSLWISATVQTDWFGTVDFRSHLDTLKTLSLGEEEKLSGPVRRRREAVKRLAPAGITLDAETSKAKARVYLEALAEKIQGTHSGDAPTLVILNNVQRSQNLYARLAKSLRGQADAPELLLVHSRFRQAERNALNQRILNVKQDDNLIIISTQAIEAGVDISSRVMFTELAPWASLVQRFGRCNRAGEHDDAQVYWLDIASDTGLALPYTLESLDYARGQLKAGLESVSAADLPPFADALPLYQVIRRKDFIDLFNTDPDLSGFDIDISPWIRDGGTPPVQVFWRDFDAMPNDQGAPERDELCPVSIAQIKDHLKKIKGQAVVFKWDALGRKWQSVTAGSLRPGMTVLLRCKDGGYDPQTGFLPGHDKQPVQPIRQSEKVPNKEMLESYGDDPRSVSSRPVRLATHLIDVRKEAEQLCDTVDEFEERASVVKAARWHDVGKAHRAFKTMLLYNDDEDAANKESELWAKGSTRGRSIYAVCGGKGGYTERRYFRHELASMLAWLQHGPRDESHDLIAYLIAAHHGKVRLGLRALPDETMPEDGRRFARGVWEGDRLPALEFDDVQLPETELHLGIMELGDSAMGASWSTRTQRLLQRYGPFRLAWLEMLVRIADWRASARYSVEASE